MKGMVFVGCSYTWGQGLWYYSDLPNIIEPEPYQFNSKLVTDSHNLYRKTKYFPRLVANHYNTFEVTKKDNGGSEEISFDFLNSIFKIEKFAYDREFKLNFDDIDYIVFQTSHYARNRFFYINKTKNNEYEKMDFKLQQTENRQVKKEQEIFFNYLKYQRESTFDEWNNDFLKQWIKIIENNLQFFESKGIKTLIINWHNDYLPFIKSNEWLNNRLIKLQHNDKEYESIVDLMENETITIDKDYVNFTNSPQDHHPSKLCHEIVANSIINKIDKNINELKKYNSIDYINYANVIENLHVNENINTKLRCII
jgi:hypothetical protein